ncbi:MAG: hypothetical protein EA422_13310 [Gemmatimonadales bacterium]|nr:MAG: hypothetical protein EA422_13310 [Gemmatimonadales bacterium]
MGRALVVLIVLLLLGLTFEPSREIMVETARPALVPAYRWMTLHEMNQIVKDLESHQETRGPLPAGDREFDAWLNQRYPQPASREDAWGTRYRLQVTADGFRVMSAGPDQEFGTGADLSREGRRLMRR